MIKEKENESSYYIETNPYRGLFVCLEGIDAAGKTTQMKRLKTFFESRKVNFIMTHEHNEKFLLGKEIQEILKEKDHNKRPSSLEFQKMYVANRKDHLEKLIIPSLEEGKLVITDRYFWSTIAYGSLGVDKDALIELNKNFIAPDLTILLNVDPKECLKRKDLSREKKEFFERLEKQEKISQTYQWLKSNFKNNIFVLSGNGKENAISNEIIDIVTRHPKFYNSERIKS